MEQKWSRLQQQFGTIPRLPAFPNVGVHAVPKARSGLDGDIFGEDNQDATQQPRNMGMSRRKQHLIATHEQKKRDKYAEEKEVDVGELQTLDEPAHDDISKQVCPRKSASRSTTDTRFYN
jgi:hypothetical protein